MCIFLLFVRKNDILKEKSGNKAMKKRTLKKEYTILMMAVSACTLLAACAAVLYVFFSFFVENTREDIEYVLNNTSQEYQSHMQFIEDGAVSIRHNRMLDDFFEAGRTGGTFDREEAEPQLSYSMELFSNRNMIDRQMPFVTSVYLFNNRGDCIYENYYTSTLASMTKSEAKYRNLQAKFRRGKEHYGCITDDTSINLLFRIYDDNMEEKGICVAEISRTAVNTLLDKITSYSGSTWMVLFGKERVIAYRGRWTQVEQLMDTRSVWSGLFKTRQERVIGCADTCGFGIRTVLAVEEDNIFAVLRSTIIVFAVGLIVVLVLTFFVGFGASRRLTKPVRRMIESIRAFGKQDFSVRMEESSIQEFDDIGAVFNEMAGQLEYLIKEVYEKQLLATRSQVKFLQAQLNPHFQFNILAMLSLKAKMAGNEEVYEGLNAFSRLIQGKIFREREIKIRVAEELEIVNFYLYLQKSRYQDKLSYEVTLEDERINEDLIPRLLIEPLVENAVSHGLEPKRDRGVIRVQLYEREQMLHICVKDNGVGFNPEKLAEQEAELRSETSSWDGRIGHTHTGLANTKRMLQILYEDNFQFVINGEKGKGTVVEIVIPVERSGIYVEGHSGR